MDGSNPPLPYSLQNLARFSCILLMAIAGKAHADFTLTAIESNAPNHAVGINDSGQVLGMYFPESGNATYLYSPTTGFQDIGTLGGSNTGVGGINSQGEIAGAGFLNDNTTAHAFIFTSAGGMQDIGGLGGNSSASGLNDLGQVVGSSYSSTALYWRAFIYTPGSGMQELGTIGGTTSLGTAINNAGAVVGSSRDASNRSDHAFLYTSSGGMLDLGVTDGFVSSYATAINNSGTIIGNLRSEGQATHVFLYTEAGGMQDLGTLNGAVASTASAINDSGEIVGSANFSAFGFNESAFLYTASTGMQDLNTLYSSLLVSGTDSQAGFVKLTEAAGINSKGDIVGVGTYYDGFSTSERGFILAAEVPEPSALLSLAGGLCWLATRRHRGHSSPMTEGHEAGTSKGDD